MIKKNTILIVDDEFIARESMGNWLKEDGYLIDTCENGIDALDLISSKKIDLAIVDLKMPGMDGMELLRRSLKVNPELPILIMTAFASIDTAVQAMKEGAYDYLVKPLDPENVSQVIDRALKYKRLEKENLLLHKELNKRYEFDEIIGKSKKIQEVFDLVRSVSSSDVVVMIRGESGTGKELIAQAIHNTSKRKHGPLVALSCCALPENLLESELFGYEKGSFTGANKTHKGKFEMANGGTLFFDEIGDISKKTQMELLRVIQEKSFYRIGSNRPIEVDIRIISATNQDLEKAVQKGTFREDLYYRLNVVVIHLPPLRERKEDIPLLVKSFVEKFSLENSVRIADVSSSCMELLMNYNWPGNIRELENVIERAVVIGKNEEIGPEDLPEEVRQKEKLMGCVPQTLAELEKMHIIETLNDSDWNISTTAYKLGVDRVTIYNKLKKYNISKKNYIP